jgi:hypothetical protein
MNMEDELDWKDLNLLVRVFSFRLFSKWPHEVS